jgi:hypothetical protein
MHDHVRWPQGCGGDSIDPMLEAWRDLGSFVALSRRARAARPGLEADMASVKIRDLASDASESAGYM